jgi:SP family facilitated glucose transporter-like MFS transporter 8
MTIKLQGDVEQGEIIGLEDLEKPLIFEEKIVVINDNNETDQDQESTGSIGMVLLCTFVAVCGSFEFGSCVSTLNSLSLSLSLSLFVISIKDGKWSSWFKRCSWFTKWIFSFSFFFLAFDFG